MGGIGASDLSGSLKILIPANTTDALASKIVNGIFDATLELIQKNGHDPSPILPTLIRGEGVQSLGQPGTRPREIMGFQTPAGEIKAILELSRQAPDPEPPARQGVEPSGATREALMEFLKAVQKTMEVQFNTRIQADAPFKRPNGPAFSFDAGSVIGVSEKHFHGYFGMFYEKATLVGLMNTMLGTDYTEIAPEIEDGASEITNICFGLAKQILNERGHQIRMALPGLVCGRKLTTIQALNRNETVVVVPLSTGHGKFWIELAYRGPA
ncbi:MAG: hypothetical protein EBX52_14440 [Proteobacteria bacterium]|nr:hypothetical protein [Pseudomonadota bacterium]